MPTNYQSSMAGVCPVKTADDGTVFCLHGDKISVQSRLQIREAVRYPLHCAAERAEERVEVLALQYERASMRSS